MKDPLSHVQLSTSMEPVALSRCCDTDDIESDAFSINCSLRMVRVEESVCLLSKINYCFPSPKIVVAEAMRHADCLNQRLSQSKVHVVKDIDSDRGYFLQLDSVLKGEANRQAVDRFLGGVTEDVEVMLKYFQQAVDRPQVKRLSAVAEDCNVVGLQTAVALVA